MCKGFDNPMRGIIERRSRHRFLSTFHQIWDIIMGANS